MKTWKLRGTGWVWYSRGASKFGFKFWIQGENFIDICFNFGYSSLILDMSQCWFLKAKLEVCFGDAGMKKTSSSPEVCQIMIITRKRELQSKFCLQRLHDFPKYPAELAWRGRSEARKWIGASSEEHLQRGGNKRLLCQENCESSWCRPSGLCNEFQVFSTWLATLAFYIGITKLDPIWTVMQFFANFVHESLSPHWQIMSLINEYDLMVSMQCDRWAGSHWTESWVEPRGSQPGSTR